MTLNDNKFGILTNWQRALFLRRVETPGRETLEYFLVERDGPISMLKAWVGMILLAENDWFYSSPSLCSTPPAPSRHFTRATQTEWTRAITVAENYHSHPIDGHYQCLPLHFRLCRFDLSSTRIGNSGCVVSAQLLRPPPSKNPLHVVCKTVDVLRYPDMGELLENEASAYAALVHLQGQAIPTVYGFYDIWGILRLLALEPVGNPISEDEKINQTLRMKMKAALRRIHDAGFIHGDITRQNFCIMDGKVFLVDLETCQPFQERSELEIEMEQVDAL